MGLNAQDNFLKCMQNRKITHELSYLQHIKGMNTDQETGENNVFPSVPKKYFIHNE